MLVTYRVTLNEQEPTSSPDRIYDIMVEEDQNWEKPLLNTVWEEEGYSTARVHNSHYRIYSLGEGKYGIALDPEYVSQWNDSLDEDDEENHLKDSEGDYEYIFTIEEYHEFDYEKEVDVETFLFGGEYGGPYNRQHMDGFHPINQDFDFENTEENFEEFRCIIEHLLEDYCWNTEIDTAVDMCERNDACQTFKCPDVETIREWYETRRDQYGKENL